MTELCQAWIYVGDMERAIEWYCGVLGFEVSRRDYYPHCVELRGGGGLTLGMHQTGDEAPWYSPGRPVAELVRQRSSSGPRPPSRSASGSRTST